MEHTVLLTSEDGDVDSTEYDHVISVENVLTEVTRDEILEAISRVSSLDVPDTGCIAFPVLWRRLTKPQTNNLTRAILFSKQLESRLEELGVTQGTVVCGTSLEQPYVRVIEDVAEMNSLKIRREGQSQSVSMLFVLLNIIGVMIKMGSVLGDWVFAQLAALGSDSAENSVAYLPSIERLNSTLPVIELFETKPQTIITEPSWYYALQFETKASLADCNTVGIHQYLSVSGFVGQIRDLGTIFRELLTANSFAPALANSVEAEFGVSLESATRGLVRDNLSNFHLVRALVLRRSLRAVFAADHVEKVVMGTLDPVGRAIVHEATEHDVQVYHIPHSIATTHPPNPGRDVVQFLSGEMDIQYYKRIVPEDQWWRWVPAGRPYLSELAEQYGDQKDNQSTDRDEHNRFTVLLATQPFSRDVRKQFVETMLASFGPDRFEVTVKPHPDEDVELYRDINSEYENLRVITDGLYEEIVESDLTVTVSSNVGLESIVIGTPAVCFNAWEPFILEQTFAFADEVPVFRTEAEFQTFAGELDSEELSQLWTQQQTFIDRSYRIEPDIATTIAEYIESDSVSK